MRKLLGVILFCLAAFPAFAEVSLPRILSDNMVLQQKDKVHLWGNAAPGRTISVRASWDSTEYRTKSGQDGSWDILINTPAATAEPQSITISDGTPLTLNNILIGEVWLCSGQSNMYMPVGGFSDQPVEGGLQAILDAPAQKLIRIANVKREESASPMDDCTVSWSCCSPETVQVTSAVAYFFADQLSRSLEGIPVGIICTSYGGTPIQYWMPEQVFRRIVPADIAAARFPKREKKPNLVGGLYNAMIFPLTQFRVRGFLWYQGESNVAQNDWYNALLDGMARSWRDVWKNDSLPFYVVQIAPFSGKGSTRTERVKLIEAQIKTMETTPGVYVIPTTDLGEENCIHPAKKREVGMRAAASALNHTYGMTGIPCEAPSLKECQFVEGKAILTFDGLYGRGLSPWHGEVKGFEIAGKNRMFYKAIATVLPSKGQVEVHSPMVSEPVAVRYAYHNWTEANLKNGFGLPAWPFRTDDWDDVR